ncbi:PHP domain-containing protein [Natronorarus salvus]|uniref:PHP domain-containing protein n=1 Tax=Natronorarus salvus TaxID=3117733 RepID=UPI002F26D9EE
MIVADCHVHTTASDGSLTVDRIPGAAREAGLSAVCVTDHDRPHPDLDSPVTECDGVSVIHGIELRVETKEEPVDLLGYGLRRTDGLTAEVERIQENRIERGRAIVERVERHLEIDLDLDPEEGFGRPHVARAIDRHPDTDLSYGEAFERLIGNDGPCYVAREIPAFEHGVSVLRGACALVGLAHPLRYAEPERALARCSDLDCVERYYPYEYAVDPDPVDRVIREFDLLATGGSDAHDDRLGVAGLDGETYRRVRRRLQAVS